MNFSGNFTQQEAIPEEAITAAVSVMRSGRLHRYNLGKSDTASAVDELELAFARYQGSRYALACASGGYALQLALRAMALGSGDTVLTNAFTLSPVPGAIKAVGANPLLVETTPDLVIDCNDLEAKLAASGARCVMLSHMRGHLADMRRVQSIVHAYKARLIEDCAHTMGARYAGKPSGSLGDMACFSTQTYKHINSGEGGLLTCDDDELMARAIVLSGSYMLYGRHLAGPPDEAFAELRLATPNMSGRMDNLRAAMLLPQLAGLDNNAERWRKRHQAMASVLEASELVAMPVPDADAIEVPSSLQFRVPSLSNADAAALPARCLKRGVEIKWFGAAEPHGYTSTHNSWQYIQQQALPRTDEILARLYDIRLPLTFSEDDCRLIAEIIVDELASLSEVTVA